MGDVCIWYMGYVGKKRCRLGAEKRFGQSPSAEEGCEHFIQTQAHSDISKVGVGVSGRCVQED